MADIAKGVRIWFKQRLCGVNLCVLLKKIQSQKSIFTERTTNRITELWLCFLLRSEPSAPWLIVSFFFFFGEGVYPIFFCKGSLHYMLQWIFDGAIFCVQSFTNSCALFGGFENARFRGTALPFFAAVVWEGFDGGVTVTVTPINTRWYDNGWEHWGGSRVTFDLPGGLFPHI